MNREQMIAFHHQRFAEYGYEIIPINETTVQFASMKDQKPKPAQAEPAPARRVILPPRNIVTPPKDDQQEEGPFTIVCLQAPLRHEILPLYEELVKKKIIIDPTIDETITMTIFSSKKMDRAEAINFCEESFKASGYEIVPADKTSLKFQPIKSKDPEK